MKFSIKIFFSKCDQICRKLRIWSHLLKISLMENFIFCAVVCLKSIRLCNCLSQASSFASLPFFPEYRWISSKKIFHRPTNNEHSSVICHYKRTFFWSILFLSKSQQRGTPQRLLDKCNSLLIWISLKQSDMAIAPCDFGLRRALFCLYPFQTEKMHFPQVTMQFLTKPCIHIFVALFNQENP